MNLAPLPGGGAQLAAGDFAPNMAETRITRLVSQASK